jgi:hypothetical protein
MIRAAYLPPSHRLLRPSPPTLDARTVVVVEDVVLNRVDERNDVTPVARVTAIEFTIVRRSFDHRDYSRVSANDDTDPTTTTHSSVAAYDARRRPVRSFDRSVETSDYMRSAFDRSIDRSTHRQTGWRPREEDPNDPNDGTRPTHPFVVRYVINPPFPFPFPCPSNPHRKE